MKYAELLESKKHRLAPSGLEPKSMPSILFPFQKSVVERAVRTGRFCIWADCGLGKTLMQLAWAKQIPERVLIVAPLAVADQTIHEAQKIDIPVSYSREGPKGRVTITNYEMLHKFNPDDFNGLVLDESSILKSIDGKIRTLVLTEFTRVPYRLACTATPAPNDSMELGNHAEFVGACKYSEMLSSFFVHDGGETQKWRLKRHAHDSFWGWVSSWAVMFRKPSDIGFDDDGFELPPIEVHKHIVKSDWRPKNYFGMAPWQASDLRDRITARKMSVAERVKYCAEMIQMSDRPWIIWCNLNSESKALADSILGSIEVRGSDLIETKSDRLIGFTEGRYRILITKPSIAGFGLNWQHCSNVAFVGLSDSWEQYYQAVRRCWRFGQKKKVQVNLIISHSEGPVLTNILRKEADADKMMTKMVETIGSTDQIEQMDTYMTNKANGKRWRIYQGDCVEVIKENIKPHSIDYCIFSPPFANLYVYSSSLRDMGNVRDDREFFEHFSHLIPGLFNSLKAGRLVSFHCMNLPTSKVRDGVIGIRDFRGALIRAFTKAGFIFHSEVCIWKDPVVAMQRTKALGLLWKQLKKDSSQARQGIPDYLVTMRKPGVSSIPIRHTPEGFPVTLWQKWASPVWTDINPSDTLQYRSARDHRDERHIAPLQLEVIRRATFLWSNPGDIVLSPFAGIGSEGAMALECGRRFIGIELKDSYYRQAVGNLKAAEEKGRLRSILTSHED